MPITPQSIKLTFDVAAQNVLADYDIKKKRSRKWAERRITHHLLPFFGGKRLSAISTVDIRAFIAKRQAATTSVQHAHDVTRKDGTIRHVPERRHPIAGVSAGEINRELALLKRAFRLAVEDGVYHGRVPRSRC